MIHKVWPSFPPPCTFQVLFDKPCLTCGMTRGMRALARGDIASAIGYNILVLPAAIGTVLEILYRTTVLIIMRQKPIPPRIVKFDLGLHLVLLGFYACFALIFTIWQLLLF